MSLSEEGSGRMPRRCAATLPLFSGKDILMLNLLFRRGGGGGVEGGLPAGETRLGSFDSNVSFGEKSQ